MVGQADEILTLAEIAALLRVPEEAVLDLVAKEAIPARKIGKDWRFLKRAVVDWLRFSQRTPGEPHLGFPFWLIEQLLSEDFIVLLERRLAERQVQSDAPRRGSKKAVMRYFGVFKDDDDLEQQLANLEAQRKTGGR